MLGRPRILVEGAGSDAPDQIDRWLSEEGFEVLDADSALLALNPADHGHPDAILLTATPAGKEGLERFCRLRQATEACILILARDGGREKAASFLEAGADDYIVEPYIREEVLARLRACLRRRGSLGSTDGGRTPGKLLWLTDPPRHLVFVDGCTVKLTPREFGVLEYLAKHCGKVLSADAILSNVWGPGHVGDHHLLKQFIYRLRSKLEPTPETPRWILTVRGCGYVLDPSS